MTVQIGDIFWMSVQYPSTGEIVTRPIVIYGFFEDEPLLAGIATITRSEIKNFNNRFDKWKVPIFNYKESNLDLSYVKVNCLAKVDKEYIGTLNKIGKMNRKDLRNVINKIEEFINSDEEYW